MSTSEVLVYDPTALYLNLLSDPNFAYVFADSYDCQEVNLLIGFLEFEGRPEVAALWKHHHLADCDDPRLH